MPSLPRPPPIFTCRYWYVLGLGFTSGEDGNTILLRSHCSLPIKHKAESLHGSPRRRWFFRRVSPSIELPTSHVFAAMNHSRS